MIQESLRKACFSEGLRKIQKATRAQELVSRVLLFTLNLEYISHWSVTMRLTFLSCSNVKPCPDLDLSLRPYQSRAKKVKRCRVL